MHPVFTSATYRRLKKTNVEVVQWRGKMYKKRVLHELLAGYAYSSITFKVFVAVAVVVSKA